MVGVRDSSLPSSSKGRLPRFLAQFVIVLVAAPIWLVIFQSAVLRRQWDGGIFLSVSAGLSQGLNLYTGIWDNKDPFFYGFMTLSSLVHPELPFVLDWFWIPLAALGAALLAARVSGSFGALISGLIITPLAIYLTAYVPGYTNTPGTALTLTAWGLVVWKRWALTGAVLAILALTKLVILPVALLGLVGLLAIPPYRRTIAASIASFVGGLAVGLGLLAYLGWLMPWVDALFKNVRYSQDLATYRAQPAHPFVRLWEVLAGWQSATWLLAVAGVVSLTLGFLIARRTRSLHILTASILTFAAAVGVMGILSVTYSWPHHAQAFTLPLIMWGVLIVSMASNMFGWSVGAIGVTVASLIFAVVQSSLSFANTWSNAERHFVEARVQTGEIPIEATVLNEVPMPSFAFARLGTNDDRGFIRELRPGVRLGCSVFHQYPFTPPEIFNSLRECVQDTDIVLISAEYEIVSQENSSAREVLEYVTSNRECVRTESVFLCTRNLSILEPKRMQ